MAQAQDREYSVKKRALKKSLLWSLLLFFLIFSNPQFGFAAYCNRTQSSDEQIPPQYDEPSPKPSTRRRIVDPDKFPPKSSLAARILLAPFRYIAPSINDGVTVAEKRFFTIDRFSKKSGPEGFSVKPLFGSLGDGTGLGAGFSISTGDSISKNFILFSSAQVTTRKYLVTFLGFKADPTGGGGRFFSIEMNSRYRHRPEEDFFGPGINSLEGQRTTYNLQERGVGLRASLNLPFHLRVGAGIDYSGSRVFGGKDDRYAQIQEVFGSSNLPGLVEGGAALLGYYGFIQFDMRDNPSYPRSGSYINFSITSNDSVGRGDFGFINYFLDGRGYIPLGTKSRVLALRVIGNFNDRKGGSEIPFFRLARLGDLDTLRGYGTYRFHARNSISSNIEYRYRLGRWMDALLFTDIGQVFDRASEISTRNMHATFGGGIQFRSENKVFFKILVGKSGDGTRVFFTFGPTF
jgi:outer membrane protein assembly factor BamA